MPIGSSGSTLCGWARIAVLVAILIPSCCLYPRIPDGSWHAEQRGILATTQLSLPQVPLSETTSYVWDFYGVGYRDDTASVDIMVDAGEAFPYWRLPVEATLTIWEDGAEIWRYSGFLASPDWAHGNPGLFPETANFWMNSRWTYSIDPSRYDEDYSASSRGQFRPYGPQGRWDDVEIERCSEHQVVLELRVFGRIPDGLTILVRLNNTGK